MSWTKPADVRAQVQRLWDKGLILASLVTAEALFPRRLALKGPSSTELATRFEEVRSWIAELRVGVHYRVTMRELRHRVLGANTIPDELWIDTVDDALALIGKMREARRFNAIAALTRERQPLLCTWLARYPLRVLALADDWHLLLDIVGWMQAHPRPGVYLRQIDIPGVHTKLIEAHRAMLSELFDLALPPQSIALDASGPGSFCRRYGFRDKPIRVRLRVLDPKLALLPGDGEPDITLTHDTFARLQTNATRIFITENEINFLAFPPTLDSLVVFGAGYGFEMLADAHWLHRCRVHYWGDIDTHGFAILDQLRGCLPHAQSFLMDRETLLAHELQWGTELQPLRRDLTRLSAPERELFDDLRDNRIREGVRLEQERIRFGWVQRALEGLQSIAEAR